MRKACIVIGSNYGDEGKGLVSCTLAATGVRPCLNILINGGAQRGHTVDLPDGRRHVFQHFGSGALVGAVSCADADFIVNPMLFISEREELSRAFPEANLRLLVNEGCRVTLPCDMMLNQILEDARGSARHGSCGVGIYETRHRYEQTDWALGFKALAALSEDGFRAYCLRVAREYIPDRLREEGFELPDRWRELMESEGLIAHSYDDLQRMRRLAESFGDWAHTAEAFETLIFEAGQGLALDELNIADSPHLTPSRTTSAVSCERIAALGGEIETEIVYVTRSYITRHGAGPLRNECTADDIMPGMVDRTNVPNPFQQTLRYAPFDTAAVMARIEKDRAKAKTILPKATFTIAITHLNETGGKLFGTTSTLSELSGNFDKARLSDSPFGNWKTL